MKMPRYLKEVIEENNRLREQFALVEQQNSNLANLYVAAYQLAGTVDHATVLQSIQEIIANLVGSEEVGIYGMSDDRTMLVLARSFGIDEVRLAAIKVGEGKIGAAAASGEIYVSPSGTPDEENITACIPLRIESEVIGLIAIFGLLAHKPALADIDRDMFDLLAIHAATSLYCATLHEERFANA